MPITGRKRVHKVIVYAHLTFQSALQDSSDVRSIYSFLSKSMLMLYSVQKGRLRRYLATTMAHQSIHYSRT